MNNIFVLLGLFNIIHSTPNYLEFEINSTESSEFLYSESLARDTSEYLSYSKSRNLCFNFNGSLFIKTIYSPYNTRCSTIIDQDQFKYKCRTEFISYCRVSK